MSPGIRLLTGREVIAALRAFGFEVVATRGSHAKMRRVLPTGETQTITIPIHRSLARGTVRAIFRQAARFIPERELRAWFFKE